MKIKIETTVSASLEKVWACWTTPADINQWNAASDDWHTINSHVDLTEGGNFSYRMEAKDGSMGFDFDGTYTSIKYQESIEYKLGDDREVTVQFIHTDSGISVVEEFDAETINDPELQKQGWQAILDNFKSYVESKS